MEEFLILDGSSIRDALIGAQFPERASQRFKRLTQSNAEGVISASDLLTAAEEEAAALLLGSEHFGRQVVVSSAATKLPDQGDVKLDSTGFEKSLRDYLQAVADALREEPIVVSVLDGESLRSLLDDEDEFAMAAETVFEQLDADNSGKLNRSELRSGVQKLVAAVGFPSPSAKPEVDELVTKLLIKYAGEGSQELGQTQFAKLLQDVMQDMVDSLGAQPIIVVRDMKVLDGSNLRKVLDNEPLLLEMANSTFKELDLNKDGKLSKSEIRPVFENRAVQLGLPRFGESVEELYSEVFKEVDVDGSGLVDEHEFQQLMRAVIENFAAQLKLNPILVDVETAIQ